MTTDDLDRAVQIPAVGRTAENGDRTVEHHRQLRKIGEPVNRFTRSETNGVFG
jgi:hypothetical protein